MNAATASTPTAIANGDRRAATTGGCTLPILTHPRALEWQGNAEGRWQALDTLDLGDLPDSGIYVIWHGGRRPRVVRVGHGQLADRLAALRDDPHLRSYARFGTLFVTWAAVPGALARGAAKFVANRLRPVQEDPVPGVSAVPVTTPF